MRRYLIDQMRPPLFVTTSPRPEEVRMLPGRRNCYLLAAAQAVAARQPQVLRAAIRAYDGDVIVSSPGAMAPLRVSGDLSRWQGRATEVTWPAAVEASYAYACGGTHVLLGHGEPSDALHYLTGMQASTFAVTVGRRTLTNDVAALWQRGECVVLHTKEHAFAVVGVEIGARSQMLLLMDPRRRWWQRSNRRIAWNEARGLGQNFIAYSMTHSSATGPSP